MPSEAVKVAIRIRPINDKEIKEKSVVVVKADQKTGAVAIRNPNVRTSLATGAAVDDSDDPSREKGFTFDSSFDQDSKQEDVYAMTARPIVEGVLEGYNGTIFAYGQTGTGKTWTMQGSNKPNETHLRGIIPNSFFHIFGHIGLKRDNTRHLVRVSYLEIYNEDVRDLLNPKYAEKLQIRESPEKGVHVPDLTVIEVNSVEDMENLMTAGNSNRSVGETKMNKESSRSHSIFTIIIERADIGPDGKEHIKVGKLNLVDLAGSEKLDKTGATGDRAVEATKINLSLTTLGIVMTMLVESATHIPYRDSKLTRLLQDSLGGNARTLMIATLSPADSNYPESLNTLRYANRAKNIKNKPKINEDPKDAKLREFQDEINRLKAQLAQMEGGEGPEEEEEEVEQEEEYPETLEDGTVVVKSRKIKVRQPTRRKSRHDAEMAKIAEMQAGIEEERKALLQSKDVAEEERKKVAAELEKRAAELEKERQEREELAAKLTEMETKLLVGGVSIIDIDIKTKEMLAKQQALIAEQNRKQSEMTEELQRKQETHLQIEEQYTTLQEEANAKHKKLKNLIKMLMASKEEIRDLQQEYQRDREGLLESIQGLMREVNQKLAIISAFIPPKILHILEQNAEYDESNDRWRIRFMNNAGNNLKKSKKKEMMDFTEDEYGTVNEGYEMIDPSELSEDDFETSSGFSEFTAQNNPLTTFPDVYMSYEQVVPGSMAARKAAEIEKAKISSSRGRAQSRGALNKPKTVGSVYAAAAAIAEETPKARGLVEKKKHFA